MDRRDFIARLSTAAALSAFLSELSGCHRASNQTAQASAQLSDGLTQEQLRFIETVSEHIIPATDTPGAEAAGVPELIALLYREWLLPEGQANFSRGISELNAECIAQHGYAFADRGNTEQIALLRKWDEAAFSQATAAASFFRMLKQLVIVGYYTSEIGQNIELEAVLGAGENDPTGPIGMRPPFKI